MFADLPLGLYLVKQTGEVAGYALCTAFLVSVPHEEEGTYTYDVKAFPKIDVEKLTSITIKKVWNTDASAEKTDKVMVQLLLHGSVIETATLREDNQWQVTYENLPESDGYSIVETNIPRGFTATYMQSGNVYTVTNSASLIQTGQLVWPIPVLAMAGIVFITIGVVALQKKRDHHA